MKFNKYLGCLLSALVCVGLAGTQSQAAGGCCGNDEVKLTQRAKALLIGNTKVPGAKSNVWKQCSVDSSPVIPKFNITDDAKTLVFGEISGGMANTFSYSSTSSAEGQPDEIIGAGECSIENVKKTNFVIFSQHDMTLACRSTAGTARNISSIVHGGRAWDARNRFKRIEVIVVIRGLSSETYCR